jgi:protein gp37
MNPCKKTIGWADYTWNPIVGCKRNCRYCYAKRMNDRFKWIPEWTEPVLFYERLGDPMYLKKTSVIFVGSMCDLFGDWIPDEWIKEVRNYCDPPHKYMFLTKNPARYLEFNFPFNTMLGCTITHDSPKARYDMRIMKDLKENHYNTFVSIEPIFSGFKELSFDMFDLVIIGAQTGTKPVIPQLDWVTSIKHANIFYKKNIIKHFPELNNKNHEL